MITFKDLKQRLNKPCHKADISEAVREILYSYPFKFRERTHLILVKPKETSFDLFYIKDIYRICLNDKALQIDEYQITDNKLLLKQPVEENSILIINYLTDEIGHNSDGGIITSLSSDTDVLFIPSYLEELFIEWLKAKLEEKRMQKLFMKYAKEQTND